MKQSKETLKEYFETGDKPTQEQYSDLIDSYVDSQQEIGEANRRFVIDETGEVSVTSEQEISEYELNTYEANTSEKYKVKLLKDGAVISEANLTETFEPIIADVAILKDIEFINFITIENGLEADYSNIDEIASTNGDYTIAKGEDLTRPKFIQKKQNIYNLEQCLLYLQPKPGGYTNANAEADKLYSVRVRSRVLVGDYYVYDIDLSGLDTIGYTTNDKFNFAFRRFGVPVTEITSSETSDLPADFYEEGTWNPLIKKGVTNGVIGSSITSYARVGNIVTFTLQINELTTPNAGGDLNITLPDGLPSIDGAVVFINRIIVGVDGTNSSLSVQAKCIGDKIYFNDKEGLSYNLIFSAPGTNLTLGGSYITNIYTP